MARARRALLLQGKRIQKLRLEKGWTRTTLAAKAGVTVTTLRSCETGTKVTQRDKLQQIVTALGKSLAWLESDEAHDPRVRHWTDEDYEIGTWYHNAPRAVKNWIWTLQESSAAAMAAAFGDPTFLRILGLWPQLTPEQRAWVLKSFEFVRDFPPSEGGHDAVSAASTPKVRGPHR